MAVRFVPIILGGQERQLRFALSAWAAVEDHGYDLQGLLDALHGNGNGKRLSLKAVRVVLWAMLQEEEDPPTLKEVGRWVDGDNFSDVMAKAGEAMRLAFPEARGSPP